MLKRSHLACVSLVLLTACATAPTVPPTQVVTICPRLPSLEPLDPETADALERPFIDQMQNFLSGLLPMQPDYKLRSGPAAPPGKPTLKH